MSTWIKISTCLIPDNHKLSYSCAAIITLLSATFAALAQAVELDLPYPRDEITALEIARQSYFVDHFYAFDNFSVGYKSRPDMLLMTEGNDAWQVIKTERTITHRPKNQQLKTQDLVVFKSGKIRGTGVLLNDFKQSKPMEIRMWLPALRKIRRFSEPAREDIWGGSLLTYGDLYLRRPEHELHRVIGVKKLNQCLEDITLISKKMQSKLDQKTVPWCSAKDREVYVIESKSTQQPWWYDYRIRLIDKKSFAEYQVEYFKNGQLFKRFQKNWRSSELNDPRAQVFSFWSVVKFEAGLVTARSLAWSPAQSMSWNQNMPTRVWSESSLRKIRK